MPEDAERARLRKPDPTGCPSKNITEVQDKVKAILGGTLVTHQTGPEGKRVNKVLIAEDVYYPGESEPKEYYMSILLDRSRACPVVMASTEGGMNIEEVAETHPEKIIKNGSIQRSITAFQARKLACTGWKEMHSRRVKFIHSL
jgi:succinyl-CoA synthetase beta subunit